MRNVGGSRSTNGAGVYRSGYRIIMVAVMSVSIEDEDERIPIVYKVKAEGKTSTNPLKESFGHKYNFKFVLLALFWRYHGAGYSMVYRTILCPQFYSEWHCM